MFNDNVVFQFEFQPLLLYSPEPSTYSPPILLLQNIILSVVIEVLQLDQMLQFLQIEVHGSIEKVGFVVMTALILLEMKNTYSPHLKASLRLRLRPAHRGEPRCVLAQSPRCAQLVCKRTLLDLRGRAAHLVRVKVRVKVG